MELTGLTRASATVTPPAPRRGWGELRFAPPPLPREQQGRRRRRKVVVVVAAISEEVPRLASTGIKGGGGERWAAPEKVALRAALTVRRKQKEDIKEAVAGHLDALWDMVGRNVVLELISTKIHPRTKKPMQSGRVSIKDWCQKRGAKGDHVVYTAEFTVDADFGEPGAIAVANRHNREFFLESIVVEGGGLPCGPVHFACNSWVQSTRELPTKRVFFVVDMLAESRVEKPHPIYVPRDEAFEELKQGAFSSGRLRAVLHTLIPSLIASISAETHNFQGFHHIDNLYKEGLRLKLGLQEHLEPVCQQKMLVQIQQSELPL